jgi:hypothetical protein
MGDNEQNMEGANKTQQSHRHPTFTAIDQQHNLGVRHGEHFQVFRMFGYNSVTMQHKLQPQSTLRSTLLL